ncbi:MAG: hypothetical protein CMI30_13100 [Opitutae bacterium]|nr:hypothetical protein [Opitutae bacterium]|tara:strand:- start:4700 stop:6343 length:1644 start_codon:yes stop_codon:yes gene_type:complete
MKMDRDDFWRAVGDGSTRRVLNCIKAGLDINMRMYQGYTALHQAIKLGNLEMVNYLIKHGADINAQVAGKKESPTELAEKFEHPDIQETLKGLGAKTKEDLLKEKQALIKSQPWTEGLSGRPIKELAKAGITSKEAFMEWEFCRYSLGGYSVGEILDELQRKLKGLPTYDEERELKWQREKDERRERLAEAGFKEWSDVVRHWKDGLEHYGLSTGKIFQEIKITGPPLVNYLGLPTDEVEKSWWDKKCIDECRGIFQEICDQRPESNHSYFWEHLRSHDVHPIYVNEINKGQQRTLDYLWQAKESDSSLCAVFIQASLFPQLHSTRRRSNNNWKCEGLVYDLDRWCKDILSEVSISCDWESLSINVLPSAARDLWRKDQAIESLKSIILNLAEQHAALLHKEQLIYITRTVKPGSALDLRLKEEEAERKKKAEEWEQGREAREKEEEEARAKWQAQLAERQRQKLQEEKAKHPEHPRWGEWPPETNEELLELVWSKSTVQIAQEFGISDAAIAKRCKKVGVEKPPRGFWAKVEAGKMPHPQGKPVQQ